MINIRWEKSFNTEIEFLDTQNKHFTEIVNMLLEHLHDNPESDFLPQMFCSVAECAQEHFREEEIFLEQFNPKELSEHRQHHLLFLEKLKGSLQTAIKGSVEVKQQLGEFIRNWTVFHITCMDNCIAGSIRNSVKH